MSIDYDKLELQQRINSLEILGKGYEKVLREAYQISHYGRGSMQDIDDVLERAFHHDSGHAKAGEPSV